MTGAVSSAAPDAEEVLWIQNCRRGHRFAFEPLVRRYGPRAYGFALGMVKDREDARDLSQEAFLRAFRAIDRFDDKRPFYPWFLTILRNLCVSHLRRRRSTVAFDDIPLRLQSSSSNGLSMELRLCVQQALAALDESDREIILLKDFQDLTYAEISEVLNIPRGTVQSRLYYARRRLRDRLNGVLTPPVRKSTEERVQ